MIYQFYANIKYTCYLYDIAIYCNRSAWHVGIASHSWYWYNICILQNIYCIRDTSNKILISIYIYIYIYYLSIKIRFYCRWSPFSTPKAPTPCMKTGGGGVIVGSRRKWPSFMLPSWFLDVTVGLTEAKERACLKFIFFWITFLNLWICNEYVFQQSYSSYL